mmetsp:Transcript_36931/g.117650  ORF Transcript_36931/g.117650 Transcript_36931/m.117650 type:complete len:265 (+) Transcript_36931:114-908(+)
MTGRQAQERGQWSLLRSGGTWARTLSLWLSFWATLRRAPSAWGPRYLSSCCTSCTSPPWSSSHASRASAGSEPPSPAASVTPTCPVSRSTPACAPRSAPAWAYTAVPPPSTRCSTATARPCPLHPQSLASRSGRVAHRRTDPLLIYKETIRHPGCGVSARRASAAVRAWSGIPVQRPPCPPTHPPLLTCRTQAITRRLRAGGTLPTVALGDGAQAWKLRSRRQGLPAMPPLPVAQPARSPTPSRAAGDHRHYTPNRGVMQGAPL